MTNKEALNVIKQILDAGQKSGLFENLEASMLAANCYNHLANTLEKLEKLENDANGLIN
jgi:hypothetical protein